MNNKSSFFILYSCCIPVKGFNRSTVCDIQRDRYRLIPNALYEILDTYILNQSKSIDYIKQCYDPIYNNTIDEYFEVLAHEEYGFYSDKPVYLPKINTNKFEEPKIITNAIIDFDESSVHNLENIVPQLSLLNCEALELRFYYSLSHKEILHLLEVIDGSSIRSVEVIVKNSPSIDSVESLISLRMSCARLRKITIFNSRFNKILEHEEFYIIYSKENNLSESNCGVIEPWYFNVKTESFIESINYNSCLNRKVSIDRFGNIKNCPSMKKSYGNIINTLLDPIVHSSEFQELWSIKKDEINVCLDCELRYICQDCRAYIMDQNNIYSKPSKCKYSPYD